MAIQKRANVGEAAADAKEAVSQVLDREEAPETPAPAEPTAGTELADAPESRAVAAPATQSVNVISSLNEDGFGGLEINFTSFETIILEKSSFACTQSERKVKEDFIVQLQSSREKYMFVSGHPESENGESDREIHYSYDKNADKNDPELAAKIKSWKEEDGVGYSVKTYVEVLAVMVDDQANGDLNGEMVLLQIPPASIGKFSGFVVQQKLKGRGKPTDYQTKIGVGAKIGEGKKAFYPWTFTEAK